jgi:hypothetical protein
MKLKAGNIGGVGTGHLLLLVSRVHPTGRSSNRRPRSNCRSRSDCRLQSDYKPLRECKPGVIDSSDTIVNVEQLSHGDSLAAGWGRHSS